MLTGLFKDLPKAKDERDVVQNEESDTLEAKGNEGPDKSKPTPATTAPTAKKKGWVGTGLFAPPVTRPSVTAQQVSGTQPIGVSLGSGRKRTAHAASSNEALTPSLIDTSRGTVGDHNERLLSSFKEESIEDEYDPSRPNDYESIRKHREMQRLQAEAEAERQERMREMRRLEEMEETKNEAEGIEAKRKEALNLSGEEAWKRRAGVPSTTRDADMDGEGTVERQKGMGLAQKMLEKMGWKSGEGLGKRKQGISAPLTIEKTSATAGRIVTQPTNQPALASPVSIDASDSKRFGEPTPVILLLNVVPPGGVDEALDEEIGVECSKHGTVLSVLIFEVTEPGYPEDEAVRIFVQFEDLDAARSALGQLHGRIFDGRVVRARFYDEARFARADLAPSSLDERDNVKELK